MADFGLTSNGFVSKQLQTIKSEIEAVLKTKFGNNINLNPNAVFGNIVGIFSERESLLWQLAEAVSDSQSPEGAEGTSVDNILALNNLRRLGATPTRTNKTPITLPDGRKEYGLALFGTPGTVIIAGSIIQTDANPPLQFILDSAVTIGPEINEIQNLYLSNAPDVGTFSIGLTNLLTSNLLVTSVFNYYVKANASQLKFSQVPSSGAFDLTFVMGDVSTPLTGITFSATAGTLQAAIRALTGYSAVNVTGDFSVGFSIDFPDNCPLIQVSNNTLNAVITEQDSLQAVVNNLQDGVGVYPFSDVQVTDAVNGFVFKFGIFTPFTGQPSTGAKEQALILVESNSMQEGSTVTNIEIQSTTAGSPAQGIGSATCSQNGPNFVAAGALNTIGSPVSGWTSVINQLDCLTGTAQESDTAALVRRSANLQSQANGPLASIIQKVGQLTGVTAVEGFQNLNEAALQILAFSSMPVAGNFKLQLAGGITGNIPFNALASQVQTIIRAVTGYGDCLVTGSIAAGFTIDFNGDFGGQPQPLVIITANTTGVTITPTFGRPGKSYEIVVEGGVDTDIANTILAAGPAGIKTYGGVTIQVFDDLNNAYNISFSRPTPVPFYVVINLQTDLGQVSPKFNIGSIQEIIADVVAIGNSVGIGGDVIGFGTNGLIGAFNSVDGIIFYTLFFDRVPNPTSNANVQLQPEEVPVFESFNVKVSYT